LYRVNGVLIGIKFSAARRRGTDLYINTVVQKCHPIIS